MRVDVYHQLKRCLDADRLVALATVLAGPGRGRQLLIAPAADTAAGEARAVRLGGLGSEELEEAVEARADELLASFRSQRLSFPAGDDETDVPPEGDKWDVPPEGGKWDVSPKGSKWDVPPEGGKWDIFIEVHPPRPKLVVVGAVHVAAALVSFASTLGFRTVVVDPRTAFATPERFAHADELRTDWPGEALSALGIDENTYIALLSHDLKLDLPALEVALPSPARYVGALGSKRTHRKRVEALEEKGFSAEAIERIHNPIGLDLGGRRAEEIAVAILAEMIAVNHGKRPTDRADADDLLALGPRKK